MLYQWEVGRLTIPEVAQTFWRIGEIEPPPSERAQTRAHVLTSGTVDHLAAIDRVLEEASKNWRLDRMPVIDRLILRMGIYELLYETATPPVVVSTRRWNWRGGSAPTKPCRSSTACWTQ